VLGLIAVRATEALTARARRIIATNAARAAAFFARWRELFEYAPPRAGPIAFPRRVRAPQGCLPGRLLSSPAGFVGPDV
jgi:hypothetical protein